MLNTHSLSNTGVDKLAKDLIEQIYTTLELKQISIALESLAQNKNFKNHASELVDDEGLTNQVKKQELLALISQLEIEKLTDFFAKILDNECFWVFSAKQFDYFDNFVQAFQIKTEDIKLIHLVTAIDLQEKDLQKISLDLSETFKKHVIIHLQINPKIIGGIQIRIDNLVFDYSLKAKLGQFQRQWISKLEKTSSLLGRE
ncbi:F0F1 ATP synthase subunit delta [Candidatus Beckwithbacteria bacterium]|nr:F0F1 ATP synthase subunit delta [Candidatus Beckwithbacteria bacterium]